MIASDLAMALDSVLFMRRVGLHPDPWQRDVLQGSMVRNGRTIINNCRQCGKSSTAAALLLHTALYRPGSLSICASPGERQSGELLRKVVDGYQALGRPIPASTENRRTLE